MKTDTSKHIHKRLAALLLSLLLMTAATFNTLAASYKHGDKVRVTVDKVWAFHGGRVGNEIAGGSTANGGNRNNHYNNRLYWYEGFSIDILQINGIYTPQYDGKTYFYCIHKWTSYNDNERQFYTDPTGKGNIQNSNYWKSLSENKRDLLTLLSIYGFPARTPQQLGVNSVDDAYAATQVIAWEIITNRRTLNGFTNNYKSAGNEDTPLVAQATNNARFFYDKLMHYAYTGNGHTAGEATPALTAYNKIWADMAKHKTKASFDNQTLTMKWDASSKTYKGSINDANGMLSASSLTSSLPAGVTCSISGNTINFTAKSAVSNAVKLKFQKNETQTQMANSAPFAVLETTNGEGQEMMSGVLNDPVPFYLNIRTSSGTAKMVKKSEDNVIADVKFRITGNGVDQTVTTGKDGTVSTTLAAGTYTVTEVDVNNRYVTPASQTVTVNEGQTATVTFNNSLKKGFVELYKTDEVNGSALAGAKFGIYDKTGERFGELTTNENGYAKSGPIAYGDGYYLLEEQAPTGWLPDTQKHYFNVTENGATVQIDVIDKAQKAQIDIYKEGEVLTGADFRATELGMIYCPIYETQRLAGATIDLYAAEDIVVNGNVMIKAGELVDTQTTTEAAPASFVDLYPGTYVYREVVAPDGFFIGTNEGVVTLQAGGQETVFFETIIQNERQKSKIVFWKAWEENPVYPNPDVWQDISFGLYAAEDIFDINGDIAIAAGQLVDVSGVDQNGQGGFTVDLPVGFTGYMRELTTAKGYVLDTTEYPVIFDQPDQTIPLVRIDVNDGEKIENRVIRGTIKGLKTDRENGDVIEGAVFGLFREDETDLTEDSAIATAVSDESGVFAFEEVPYGKYTVAELKPANGFLANADVYHVDVSADEEVIEIYPVNDRIPEIDTQASVNGKKEVTAKGTITIDDVVSYKHLIPGKEYVLKGALMNKATGKPFTVNGEEIRSEVTFIPETANGEVIISFTFDASGIANDAEVVVFETLYHKGVEMAIHADIDDAAQTVRLVPLAPEVPKTGDVNMLLPLTVALTASGAGIAITWRKRKKQ